MPVVRELSEQVVQYESIGAPRAPVVVVLGGISADRHICAHASNAAPGWWEPVAGAGRPLDTSRFRLIGCDWLDGGAGLDGRPLRVVTTADQAEALADVLDELEVDRVHAVVGASYGGMVALAFAAAYPHRLDRLVVIGAAHETHPMITGIRVIQRRIVELGLETNRVRDAVVLARALGMTTYRSASEFATRFDVGPLELQDTHATFDVERYLLHYGERFADRFTPARFLALSLSADLHRVDPSAIRAATTLVAIEHDAVAPRWQVEQLANAIGSRSRVADLHSEIGHDAFLTETDTLSPILSAALS